MSYRDDRDGLQVKVEMLERELKKANRALAGRTMEDRAIRLARVEEDLARAEKLAKELTGTSGALRAQPSEARRVADIADDVALASGFLRMLRDSLDKVRAEVAAQKAAHRSSALRGLVYLLVGAVVAATASGWVVLRTARTSASNPAASVGADPGLVERQPSRATHLGRPARQPDADRSPATESGEQGQAGPLPAVRFRCRRQSPASGVLT